MAQKKTIPLGSGEIYETEYIGSIPSDNIIETEENRLGYIEKGAALVYKPTYKQFSDDLGMVTRNVLTEDEATMKLGLISWVYSKLNSICSTARITESGNKRTIKLGGVGNDDGKKHLFRFVHKDNILGDVRITIIGANTAGISLSYVKDDATKIEPEIKAEPSDNEGTLVLFEETIIPENKVYASGLSVTSAAGSSSGTTTLTITPVKTSGNSYKLYRGNARPSVSDNLSAWEDWDGTAAVTAATGDIITIAEVIASTKLCVKAGITLITAKA